MLQDVHIVGDGGPCIVAPDAVVPGGPGAAAAGQDGFIGVQDHVVAAVGKTAENSGFVSRGLFEQCESLIAVAGQHNFIEAGFRGVSDHRDGSCRAADASDGSVRDNAIGKRLDQAGDVVAGTTRDGVPLRAVGQAEQSVIAVEFKNELDGEIREGAHRAGPDGSSHGQQIVLFESASESAATQILSDSLGGTDEVSVAGSEGVESEDIKHHAEEGRAEEAGSLSENAIQAGATVFKPGAIAADGEAHFRRGTGDIQQSQQFHE